jgi:hypothetical protein
MGKLINGGGVLAGEAVITMFPVWGPMAEGDGEDGIEIGAAGKLGAVVPPRFSPTPEA